MLSTGMDITYHRIALTQATYTSYGIFDVGSLGYPLFQFQMCQLLAMCSSLGAVPFECFARLDDKYDIPTSRRIAMQFAQNTETQLDPTIHIDKNIINGDINRFAHALMAFGHTITVLFDLKKEIAQTLKDYFVRVITFITPRLKAPQSQKSIEMLNYMGIYIQQEMQFIYGRIFAARTVVPVDSIISEVTALPDISSNSQLSVDIMSISVKQDSLTSVPLLSTQQQDPSTIPNLKKRKNKKPKLPTSSTNPPSPNTIPTPTLTTGGICGWYLSDKGCSRTAGTCTREHRRPTLAEAQGVTAFFAFRKTLKQVIF